MHLNQAQIDLSSCINSLSKFDIYNQIQNFYFSYNSETPPSVTAMVGYFIRSDIPFN